MIKLGNILSEVLNSYQIECELFTDKKFNVTDILNQVRGLRKVTIVNNITPEEYEQNQELEYHLLKIKFVSRDDPKTDLEQFKADILSGMTMFGESGVMGTFGLTDFRESESAFDNYVNNVVANNEAIEASFKEREEDIKKSFQDRQAVIDKMDTSTLAAQQKKEQAQLDSQKKKLEAEIQLEEDQIERIEEIEQAKNDVRVNAQQMAMETFQMFADMKRESIQNEMNAELEALKSSHQYQRASDKRKQKMEEEVKKKYAKDQLKLFRMDQAAKLASIGMNTAEGIIKAVAAFPTSIPPGSPWTYMIGAMGAAQAGMVLSQKPPKFARGGMIGGNLHTQGGTLIEAERGEYVMSRKAVASIGQ